MSTKAQKLREAEARRRPQSQHQPKARKCMCCREPFISEGPHNRLCTQCRSKPSE